MPYITGSTAKIRRPWTLRGVGRRGLGLSTMVNGTLTYGPTLVKGTAMRPVSTRPVISNPVATAPIVRPVGPARPVTPAWGSNPPSATGGTTPAKLQNGQNWWQSQQQPTYGGNPQQPGFPTASDNPASSNNLATLVLQYQSNPSSLTQQQWQQLQAAGVIPSTVPYSNAGLVNPTASSTAASSDAIDPTTGVPYATELAAAQAGLTATTSSSVIGTDPTNGATTIFGVDWYYLAAGAVLLYMFMGKRR